MRKLKLFQVKQELKEVIQRKEIKGKEIKEKEVKGKEPIDGKVKNIVPDPKPRERHDSAGTHIAFHLILSVVQKKFKETL